MVTYLEQTGSLLHVAWLKVVVSIWPSIFLLLLFFLFLDIFSELLGNVRIHGCI
jgi:hypothetical protein